MDTSAYKAYQGGIHPELLHSRHNLRDLLRYYYGTLHSWPAGQKYQIVCKEPADKRIPDSEVEDENDG